MKGSVVILGASRGLGQELAAIYAKDGWPLVRIARSCVDEETGLDRAVHCDLASVSSSQRCAALVSSSSRIDRFYWVAGQMMRGSFAESSATAMETNIDINIRNPLKIVQAAWRRQLESPTGGKMIVVASTAARKPKGGESIYCATKAAQSSFAQAIAEESSNPKLSVGLIIPGGMKTGLWDGIAEPNYASFNDPADVAKAIHAKVESTNCRYFELDIPRGAV